MTKTGVSLQTGMDGVPSRSQVHHHAEAWEITSDVRIEELTQAEVLDRTLPGRLGCYLLPMDSVLTFHDEEHTGAERWEALLAQERTWKRGDAQHVMNHFTVERRECDAEESDVDDEGEDDYAESDECEEDEVVDDGEWESDDESVKLA